MSNKIKFERTESQLSKLNHYLFTLMRGWLSKYLTF